MSICLCIYIYHIIRTYIYIYIYIYRLLLSTQYSQLSIDFFTRSFLFHPRDDRKALQGMGAFDPCAANNHFRTEAVTRGIRECMFNQNRALRWPERLLLQKPFRAAFGPRDQLVVSHCLQLAMPAAAENLKKVCNRSFSALTAAMMICFECDIRRILLESETSLVAVLSVINCMQLMTCWSEQSRFLAEVYALFAVAKEAYDTANAESGSFEVPTAMPLVSKYWIAPVKPATPVVTILGKWSVERQALYFQRFTVATLFVQKLIETVPDGADELAEQLNQLAAFMADSMCLLHMVLQPLGFFCIA